MEYTVIPPCEALRNLVSHFWVGSWDVKSHKPKRTYYVVANSLTEITFAFNGRGKHSDLLFSVVQGHTHLPRQLSVDGFYHLIGVSLHSYAIPGLLKMPASELSKEFIPLSTILGQDGEILNEKIALATTTQERISILSDYFLSVLKGQKLEDKLIINAIQEIRRCSGEAKIKDLASDFCLSQKQFNRRFQQFSGFNPKMYSRIVRFESVINKHSSQSSLTEIAHANGYYDQAHFIHEFQSFTGFCPTDFWKISEEDN